MPERRPFVSGAYDPKQDHANLPSRPFAETINRTIDEAIQKKRTKKKYGSYNSKGAQATPETKRLTRRITGDKDD